MPFPLAALIIYGCITGGGAAAAVGGLQRLWRYLNADPAEQDGQDERMTPYVQGIAEAIASAKFKIPLIDLSPDDTQRVERKAKRDAPRFNKQLNDAAKERFGRTFSRLKKGQKSELLEWLSRQYNPNDEPV
jgi:hypothetical protein